MAHHPRVGRLDNVIGYVYSRPAQSEREHELKAITLRFLAMAKREVPSLDVASSQAFGCTFDRWRERADGRERQLRDNVLRSIPDYDPADDPRLPNSTRMDPGRVGFADAEAEELDLSSRAG